MKTYLVKVVRSPENTYHFGPFDTEEAANAFAEYQLRCVGGDSAAVVELVPGPPEVGERVSRGYAEYPDRWALGYRSGRREMMGIWAAHLPKPAADALFEYYGIDR